MAEVITYDRVDWSAGRFEFAVQLDNTFSVQMTAHKKDANMQNGYGLMATAYPPGFVQADINALLQLLNKLARETSKTAIDATQVYREGQVYIEGSPPP